MSYRIPIASWRLPNYRLPSAALRFHYWACRMVGRWGFVLVIMGFLAEILGSPVHAQEWDSRVPMPSAKMQKQIIRMIKNGDGPGYVLVPQREFRRVCQAQEELWGCAVNTMGLKVVYVLNTLYGDRLQQTIIHEYAHSVYNWRH